MKYTVENRSSVSDLWAMRYAAEQAEMLLQFPARRMTLHATYGSKRLRIVYRRYRLTTTFRVEDAT